MATDDCDIYSWRDIFFKMLDTAIVTVTRIRLKITLITHKIRLGSDQSAIALKTIEVGRRMKDTNVMVRSKSRFRISSVR